MLNLVSQQIQRIESDFRLHPVTASEIEFYLIGSQNYQVLPQFWEDISSACTQAGIALFNTGKEDGLEQHEISLKPNSDPVKIIQDTLALKSITAKIADTHGIKADFSAKPFSDRPGSGLHIHVHLADDKGKNTFYKDDFTISDALKHSIGGLLEWLPDCMAVFAPSAKSYTRFVASGNAPTTISWGANNRTVAVRLPMAAHENKRIEHRVSGADADPGKVMAVILAAIHYGLSHQCDPGAQIFGDASLPMYDLPHLPTSLEEATEHIKTSEKITGYFSVSELLPAR